LHIHPEKLPDWRHWRKAEIMGVRGKTLPDQGRIAACLMANKSTASKDCVEALQKIEANSIAVLPPQEFRACASKKTAQVHRSFRVSATEGEGDE
jgi:hypothetical protein